MLYHHLQLGVAVKDVIALRRSKGERGMLIKTAYGDRAFLFGHWANMKRGVPGEIFYSS